MELLVVWFALSAIAAYIAAQKGRSAAGLFLLSVVLSPLIGIIVALILAPATRTTASEPAPVGPLRALDAALARGLVSPDEYEAKRAKLLGESR